MIKIVYKSGNKLVKSNFKKEHFKIIKSKRKNFWIDFDSKNSKELKKVANILKINQRHLSNYIGELTMSNDNASFGFMYLAKQNKYKKIEVIFGKDYLLTIHSGICSITEKLYDEITINRFRMPFRFAFEIIDDILFKYGFYLEKIERKIDRIETKAYKKIRKAILPDIISLKMELSDFSKIIWREKALLNYIKTKNYEFIKMKDKDRFVFNDLHDDTIRLLRLIDGYKNNLSDAVSAYQSTVSLHSNIIMNRLTTIMLILTIVSTVTVFPNTIATFFGIPKLNNLASTETIISLIIFSTIVPILWLWKKKWFKF